MSFIALLVLSLAANVVLVRKLFVGNTQVIEGDSRISIVVSQPNRDFVMSEMRNFVETLHQINMGIEQNDSSLIVEAARSSGGSVAHHAPAGLIASIPMGFKTIGFDTHAKFDSIANSAEKNFDPKVTQQQVTALLGNCVACHRSYRMDVNYPTPFRETPKDLWEYAKDNPLVSIGNCRGYVFGDSLFDSFDSE